MQAPISLDELVPCAACRGEDAEDAALLAEMIGRAHAYLGSFPWCRAIRECYVGDIAIGGVVAVLLFRIEPARDGVDEWLWVVVGDLPPAYLVVDDAPAPAAALAAYIDEMRRWIDAVEAGESVDELIPLTTAGGTKRLEATADVADALARRLRYLDAEILGRRRADEPEGPSA